MGSVRTPADILSGEASCTAFNDLPNFCVPEEELQLTLSAVAASAAAQQQRPSSRLSEASRHSSLRPEHSATSTCAASEGGRCVGYEANEDKDSDCTRSSRGEVCSVKNSSAALHIMTHKLLTAPSMEIKVPSRASSCCGEHLRQPDTALTPQAFSPQQLRRPGGSNNSIRFASSAATDSSSEDGSSDDFDDETAAMLEQMDIALVDLSRAAVLARGQLGVASAAAAAAAAASTEIVSARQPAVIIKHTHQPAQVVPQPQPQPQQQPNAEQQRHGAVVVSAAASSVPPALKTPKKGFGTWLRGLRGRFGSEPSSPRDSKGVKGAGTPVHIVVVADDDSLESSNHGENQPLQGQQQPQQQLQQQGQQQCLQKQEEKAAEGRGIGVGVGSSETVVAGQQVTSSDDNRGASISW